MHSTIENEKMNILGVGAHPDDLEIGCGGSLAKYADKGHDVYLYILSRGAEGGNKTVRKEEQEQSAQILQAQKLFWGNFTDTNIEVSKKAITNFEEVVQQVDPDLTFVNYKEDTHQDHRQLAKITNSATRYVRNVLFYETPTTQNFQPDTYVDIGQKYLDKKLEALRAHSSQVNKTNIADLNILDIARSNANFRGVEGRVTYAEAFQPSRLFINM